MQQGYIPGSPNSYQQQQSQQPQFQQPQYQPDQTRMPPAAAQVNYAPPITMTAERRRNLLLLISFILGLGYAVYLIVYFMGVARQSIVPDAKDFEEVGRQIAGALASAMVTPHIIIVSLAAVFNGLAWYFNKSWAALTSAILYLVAGLIFIIYFPFVLVQMILAFIGFVKVNNERKSVWQNERTGYAS